MRRVVSQAELTEHIYPKARIAIRTPSKCSSPSAAEARGVIHETARGSVIESRTAPDETVFTARPGLARRRSLTLGLFAASTFSMHMGHPRSSFIPRHASGALALCMVAGIVIRRGLAPFDDTPPPGGYPQGTEQQRAAHIRRRSSLSSTTSMASSNTAIEPYAGRSPRPAISRTA